VIDGRTDRVRSRPAGRRPGNVKEDAVDWNVIATALALALIALGAALLAIRRARMRLDVIPKAQSQIDQLTAIDRHFQFAIDRLLAAIPRGGGQWINIAHLESAADEGDGWARLRVVTLELVDPFKLQHPSFDGASVVALDAVVRRAGLHWELVSLGVFVERDGVRQGMFHQTSALVLARERLRAEERAAGAKRRLAWELPELTRMIVAAIAALALAPRGLSEPVNAFLLCAALAVAVVEGGEAAHQARRAELVARVVLALAVPGVLLWITAFWHGDGPVDRRRFLASMLIVIAASLSSARRQRRLRVEPDTAGFLWSRELALITAGVAFLALGAVLAGSIEEPATQVVEAGASAGIAGRYLLLCLAGRRGDDSLRR
jgi:hypothetical protein